MRKAVGEPYCLICQTQLDKYQIILNTQKINLRTDRMNYTTRGREESTLWRVGGVETWFKGETDHRYSGGEGVLVMDREKARNTMHEHKIERSTQGITKRKHFPKAIDWENETADFCEFLQPTGLKDWRFISRWQGRCGALRVLQCSCGEGGQIAWEQMA